MFWRIKFHWNIDNYIKHRNTWFVVAVITPMGRVQTKARAHASKTPHHGSWSWSLQYSQINIVAVMFIRRMQLNHHSGTCLYFLISFVWASIFFSWKADLLCNHNSLHNTESDFNLQRVLLYRVDHSDTKVSYCTNSTDSISKRKNHG